MAPKIFLRKKTERTGGHGDRVTNDATHLQRHNEKKINMTNLLKTTATAVLALTISAPAYAAAHMDVNSMTCSQYNDLLAEDRDKIAMLAVSEIQEPTDGTLEENNGTATATAPLEGEPAEESPAGTSETVAENDGTATATSTVAAGDDESRFAEKIELLNLTCERNGDAMVTEAASGLAGTR